MKGKKLPVSILSSDKEYNEVMAQINTLMKTGEANLTAVERQTLGRLAEAAQRYEDKNYQLPMPQTLEEMIELKRFELRMKQKELAELLEMPESKLSKILNKKREPDVHFLKSIYYKLHIDAKFILEHI
jgi:HTH-type transcriptional regulator / antitoxin HigA